MPLVKENLRRPLLVAGEKTGFLHPEHLERTAVAKFKIADQVFHVIPQSVLREKTDNPGKILELSGGIELAGEIKIENGEFVILRFDHHNALKTKPQIGMLTKREVQIVMLVADGKVNKEIADWLNISEYTVSTHLRRIFAKLGVDSRAAMIYRWTQLF